MTRWLRRQFASNRPYDQFVRDILTVQGSTLSESPAAFYKVLTEPEVLSRSISQVFLGVRIECAHCHHHPYERWGQEDYFGFAGFFTGVGKKNLQIAIQVWDSRVPNYFFRIFGRPVRASVCECERSNEPSISQALHLMNSPEIVAKIRDRQGRVRQLADSARPASEIVDELYLATLTRFPNDEERKLTLATFPPDNSHRREATEDLLWALLNTKEFIYNH